MYSRKFYLIILFVLVILIPTQSFSDDYGMGVWRFASEHEYGNLEPSDFCYVVIKGNNLLMHWKATADPESISVYKINKGNNKKICASKITEYELNYEDMSSFRLVNDKEMLDNRKNICATITNKKLIIENWITLEWKDAYVNQAFPESILRKHYK